MKRILMILLILSFLAVPVSAAELTAPEVTGDAQDLMPQEADSFWEGVLEIAVQVLPQVQPALAEALRTCVSLMAVTLLVSLVQTLPGAGKQMTDLAGAIAIGTLLLSSSNSLISLGTQTVQELSEYGKLLLPVMTAAMAASGGTTTSAALYAGTTLFSTVLSSAVSLLLVPMIYIFLCLSVANCAIGEDLLKKLADFVKWLMTWCLKIVLYVFTGYVSITGVVSGSADAAAVKATKLTISGMVPVVGNILSDASEAVLVSADVVKNAAGVYGMLAVLAIFIGPFLKIGIQYLLLKATAAVCGVFSSKRAAALMQDFSSAMGMLLAMTGTGCLLLLISTVCFMKGVG